MTTISGLQDCYCQLKNRVDSIETSTGATQTLSMVGSELTISGGNTIDLGANGTIVSDAFGVPIGVLLPG